MQRTFVMLKPDVMNRGLIGKVVARFEDKGLKPVGMKMLRLDDETLKVHYAHLADKPFFPGIVEFMKRSPVVATVWEGKEAIEVGRKLCGVTNAREAAPGTIRGDYSMSIQANLVHASDSEEMARQEIARFFTDSELFGWESALVAYQYSKDEVE
ncbi:MAG: nucleoside-diphosphate kinase [Candidatus Diapherotrites archaeon]|nr:nucleoside-diphosphate kinase [Candidatus Diapherotrites archaeon]